jgi:hypothetical protein
VVHGELSRQTDVRARGRLLSRLTGHHWATLVLVAVGIAMRLPSVTRPILGDEHEFRQAQTAFTIRGFSHHGIDLLHPWLPIFGPPWHLAFEFPLFQALATPLVWLGLSASEAGRLLNLVCFQLTAVLLTILVRRLSSRRASVLALAFFELVPFGLQWGIANLIEFMVTALCLGMVLCAMNYLEGRSRWWLLAGSLCSGCAFAVKITTGVVWCLPVAAAALAAGGGWRQRRSWRRPTVTLLSVVGFGFFCGLLWTRHADNLKEANPFERFLTSRALTTFNFGTWHERGLMSIWQLILHRIDELMLGSWIALVVVVVLALSARPHRLVIGSLVVMTPVAVSVFFNLYALHSYYLCATFPAVAAMVGIALDRAAVLSVPYVERLASASSPMRRMVWSSVVPALAMLALLVPAYNSEDARFYVNFALVRKHPGELVRELARTPPGSRIIVVDCSYNPADLYAADRRGLMIVDAPDRPARITYQELKGYAYLASCHGRVPAVITHILRIRQEGDRFYKVLGPA